MSVLFCRSDNNNCLMNTELFADQLFEITTQVMREDDCGKYKYLLLVLTSVCGVTLSVGDSVDTCSISNVV